MRKYRDIVIIPDDTETPVCYRVKIGGEPLEQTFPSLDEAKTAALAAVRPVKVAEVKL